VGCGHGALPAHFCGARGKRDFGVPERGWPVGPFWQCGQDAVGEAFPQGSCGRWKRGYACKLLRGTPLQCAAPVSVGMGAGLCREAMTVRCRRSLPVGWLWVLDWELEDRQPVDWDDGALPYLEAFLTLRTPYAGGLPEGISPQSQLDRQQGDRLIRGFLVRLFAVSWAGTALLAVSPGLAWVAGFVAGGAYPAGSRFASMGFGGGGPV
jgi:hypothetical protein